MENNQQEPSFEELLNASEEHTRTKVRQGEKIRGRIIQMSDEIIHIDIGMRSEATLPNSEDERLTGLNEGDELDVYVQKTGHPVRLGLDPQLGSGDFSLLVTASESDQPIEGIVVGRNRGGYTINVEGNRCFCPRSQISERRLEDPDEVIGQKLKFVVIDMDVNSQDAVLSHRTHMDRLKEAAAQEARKWVVPGAVVKGEIVELMPFGAFVDLGGLQGLLHVSEISHQRVNHPKDVLNRGDEVEVEVLSIETDDRGKERIALSTRTLIPDPWEQIQFTPGQTLKGKVVRKRDFGIFIQIVEGVDGLLPVRFLKRARKSLEMDEFEEGSAIEVEVVDADPSQRQVTLALPGWDEEIKSNLKPGAPVRVRVNRHIPAGLLVEGLDDPARGLLPRRRLGMNFGKMCETYPEGTEMEVVLDAIDDRGRFSFMLKSEREEVDQEILDQFSGQADDMQHNPFADFFKDSDS